LYSPSALAASTILAVNDHSPPDENTQRPLSPYLPYLRILVVSERLHHPTRMIMMELCPSALSTACFYQVQLELRLSIISVVFLEPRVMSCWDNLKFQVDHRSAQQLLKLLPGRRIKFLTSFTRKVFPGRSQLPS